jgi:S1-C subfamily serine protease
MACRWVGPLMFAVVAVASFYLSTVKAEPPKMVTASSMSMLEQIGSLAPKLARAGDAVVAVGNPFGLEGIATLGVVSVLMRSTVGYGAFEDFLQIDALVNPGNSGGALVDVRGRRDGITTATAGG